MNAMLKPLLLVMSLGLALVTAGCDSHKVVAHQNGYRGTAMDQVATKGQIAAIKAANVLPEAIDKVDPDGKLSKDVYQNVKVLGNLDEQEFYRLMTAITAWVAPTEGCTYCHNANNFADDSLYTKIVARRMLQMTQHINADWKSHVGAVGVTCYTCHRGNHIPKNVWFNDASDMAGAGGLNGYHGGQIENVYFSGGAALVNDPFSGYLEKDNSIRIAATAALPNHTHASSTQDTTATYGLMMHFSTALGVNCTFCHNSRAFGNWAQSTPQRAKAWYAIRLVRDLNLGYLDPLKPVWPAKRLGPHGDSAKLNCATCHQGANKPLLGVSMVVDYPELQGPIPDPK